MRVLSFALRLLKRLTRLSVGLPEGSRRLLPRHALVRWLVRFRESAPWFTIIFGALYLALLVFGHLHHEPWRDETHPWIVARQADGFWDLLTGDRRYDGHPPGWFWYLRIFTWFTRDPVGLHVATILLSFGAALLLLHSAPFARPIRLLLTFSFLFGFEYGVMCRNYSLGILFTFLFCSLLRPLRPRPIVLALCLAGLALSSIYGTIIALCLLLVLIAESTGFSSGRSTPGITQWRFELRGLVAVGVVLFAAALSILSSRPPDPNPYAPSINLAAVNYPGFEFSIARLTWSTLPIRLPNDIGYWGGIDYGWRDHPGLFTAVGWALLITMVLVLAAFPVELLAFVCGAGLMVVVQLAVYPGAVRHWGHYLVLFLALAWSGRVRFPRRWGRLLPLLLLVIGLFQFESFAVALREEQRFSFSGGREVARFIERDPKLAQLPIVGGPDWAMPAVMGHLDQNFISCETPEWNQTLVFHGRRQFCTPAALVQKAASVVLATQAPVLLVTVGFAGGSPSPGVTMQRLYRSRPPTASGEDFSVYRLMPSPNVPAPPPRVIEPTAAPSSAPAAPSPSAPPSTAPAPMPSAPAAPLPPSTAPAPMPTSAPPVGTMTPAPASSPSEEAAAAPSGQ